MAISPRVTQPLLDVLEVLLDVDAGGVHGWHIIKTTGRSGPTVYLMLKRLAARGALDARWSDGPDTPGAPRRRYYQLTEQGRVEARALLAARRGVSSDG